MNKRQITTSCRLQTADYRLPFCLLTSVFCLLTSVSFVFASDAEAALAAMQRRYASVQTISGSFRLTNTDIGIEQVESGEFWLKKPALMSWEYHEPEEMLLVADGKEIFFYVPLDRQVTVQSFTAEELMSTPLKFLLGGKDIEESFFIESGYEFSEGSGNTQIVKLTPKNETLYKFLILEIDEKSSDLRRLTIRELSGRILEYVFTDLKMNVKVSDKKFRFEIPDDVEVHYQESSE